MKTLKPLTMMTALVVCAPVARLEAALYDFTTSDNINYTGGGSSLSQLIPDNTRAGVGYTISFADSGSISSLNFSLTLSGGYNGDISAYISHGGTLVQLFTMNQAVTGSGMSVTLHDSGSYGTYPTSGTPSGDYLVSGLANFDGMDAHGDWIVFFMDTSPGDMSTVSSFNLNLGVTPVPEPVNVALGLFGVLAAGGMAWRSRRSVAKGNQSSSSTC